MQHCVDCSPACLEGTGRCFATHSALTAHAFHTPCRIPEALRRWQHHVSCTLSMCVHTY
jgi:hypothetical protein